MNEITIPYPELYDWCPLGNFDYANMRGLAGLQIKGGGLIIGDVIFNGKEAIVKERV